MLPYVEGGSELIDIAKGKYKYPETFKETFKIRKGMAQKLIMELEARTDKAEKNIGKH